MTLSSNLPQLWDKVQKLRLGFKWCHSPFDSKQGDIYIWWRHRFLTALLSPKPDIDHKYKHFSTKRVELVTEWLENLVDDYIRVSYRVKTIEDLNVYIDYITLTKLT